MIRRAALPGILPWILPGILLGLLLASCGGGADAEDAPAPIGRVARGTQTVVLVAVDGLRPEHLSPYGYGIETTPNLAALAQEAVVFTDYVACCTGINGALASLLTGLYPEEHGVGSLRHRGLHALAPSRTTLAELFRDAGWATFAAVSLPQLRPEISGLDQGFDHYLAPALFEGERRTAEQTVLGMRPALARVLSVSRPLFLFVHLADPEARKPAEGADGARFLRDHLDRFRERRPLVAGALARLEEDPLGALQEVTGYLARARGSEEHTALRAAGYDSQVFVVDRWLGALVDLLRESGRYGDATLIVSGTRGALLAPPPGVGAPSFLPQIVRTPLVVRFPGGTPAGRVDALTQPVDLAPTLAEVFGWEGAPRFSGHSLLDPIERGGPGRAVAFCEVASQELRATLDGRFHVEENRVGGLVAWRRDGTRVVPEAQLPPADAARLEVLRAALVDFRRPAELDLAWGGGAALAVRWRFSEGFAGEAAVHVGGSTFPARASGLAGDARLPASGGRLVARASRRGLPMRLELELAEATPGEEGPGEQGPGEQGPGEDGPGEALRLDESRVFLGRQRLDRSLLPRLPASSAPEWPRGPDGAPLPAQASLEQQSGTWWKLRVGQEAGAPDRPVEVLVALWPPGPLDERLEWSAGQELGAAPLAGREDAWIFRGATPLELQIEKTPRRAFGLAVRIDGRTLPGSAIRHRERAFAEPGELALYLPDWLAGVTDPLDASDPGGDRPPAPGSVRIVRRGPGLASAERSALGPAELGFVEKLRGGE